MSQSDQAPVRIRAADAGEFQAWKPPQVRSGHLVALVQRETPVVEEQIEPEEQLFAGGKLTLAEFERIREEARQEGFEEGRREGFEQGRRDGLEQGLRDGLAEGQQRIEVSLARLAEMLDELEAPLAREAQALEHCLLQLVTRLAEAVTGHELASRPELILAAVQEALAQLPASSGAVRIHIHPENEVLLEPLAATQETWTLVPDTSIEPGGCLVRTAGSLVDNRVETRFRLVAEQLLARLGDGETGD